MMFERIDSNHDGDFDYDDFIRCYGNKTNGKDKPVTLDTRSVTPDPYKNS